MTDTLGIKKPNACTVGEREQFACMVRQGFNGSDESLSRRIRGAERLAFCYSEDRALVAIAGLKSCDERVNRETFVRAGAPIGSADIGVELGWVFVAPAQRRGGRGERICRELLSRVPTTAVFATTRPDNDSMIRILEALGFAPKGNPLSRRNERLQLFLRPAPTDGASDSTTIC